jgi:hypothetical protein
MMPSDSGRIPMPSTGLMNYTTVNSVDMAAQQETRLGKAHQIATLTLIPGMLSIILYFLIDIHKQVYTASQAVIKHEQQLKDHDKNIDRLERLVFNTKH